MAESDQSGNLKSEYVFFNGERIARRDNPGASGPIFYYFSDHLKTTDVVTDAQGNILNESDFYPWGGELQFANADSNHYKFTGKERDTETGLDYFGARYYSNGLGRFITPDWAAKATAVPYAEYADPQSLNLYSYVRDIPTTRVDLDGHDDSFWGDVFDAGTGFIRGAAASASLGLVGAPQPGDSGMSLFGQSMGTGMVAHLGLQATVDGIGKVGVGLVAAPETEGASLTISAEGALEASVGTLVSVGAAKNSGAIINAMAKSSTSGENSAAAQGRQAHQDYDPGKGYEKEVTLPSGKKADAVNKGKGMVKELKPNNARAIKKGERQVEGYRKELQKVHPKKQWKTKIDTYDQKK